MQNRFRLKGASLEEIRRKAEQQHGPAARIVSAERVISPGIAGLFAGDRYEAIVEVVTGHEVVTGEVVPEPDILAGTDRSAAEAAARGGRARPRIAGRRDRGPARGSRRRRTEPAPARQPRTLDGVPGLRRTARTARRRAARPGRHPCRGAQAGAAARRGRWRCTVAAPSAPLTCSCRRRHAGAPAAPAAPAVRLRESVPVPLSGTGDLVVLVGLDDDALDTALAMSTAAGGADVRTAGKLSAYGHLHVDGRQGATAARAHAVMTDQTVLVAFGLGRPATPSPGSSPSPRCPPTSCGWWSTPGASRRTPRAGWACSPRNWTSPPSQSSGRRRPPPRKPSTRLDCRWAGSTPARPARSGSEMRARTKHKQQDSSAAPHSEG